MVPALVHRKNYPAFPTSGYSVCSFKNKHHLGGHLLVARNPLRLLRPLPRPPCLKEQQEFIGVHMCLPCNKPFETREAPASHRAAKKHHHCEPCNRTFGSERQCFESTQTGIKSTRTQEYIESSSCPYRPSRNFLYPGCQSTCGNALSGSVRSHHLPGQLLHRAVRC